MLIVMDRAICQYIPRPKARNVLLPRGFSELASGRELVKLSRLTPEEAVQELEKRDEGLRFTGCITLDRIIEVEVKKTILWLGAKLTIHTPRGKLKYSLICGREFGITCDEAINSAVEILKNLGVKDQVLETTFPHPLLLG